MSTLAQLVSDLVDGRLRVVDLTQPLGPETPVIELPLRLFFETPTVADLAAYVVRSQVGEADDAALTAALAELSPEVAGDIYDRGIILTGGGALLEGMGEYMNEHTKLSVRVADEPRYAIVRGLARMFDDPLLLRRVVRTEAPPLLEEGEAYSL